jgi:hypothetical protein
MTLRKALSLLPEGRRLLRILVCQIQLIRIVLGNVAEQISLVPCDRLDLCRDAG